MSDVKLRINFISVDKQIVRNSYDEFFSVGETVQHEDEEAGSAVIQSFEVDEVSNEIKAHTNRGWAHIDFLVKLSDTRTEIRLQKVDDDTSRKINEYPLAVVGNTALECLEKLVGAINHDQIDTENNFLMIVTD